LRPQCAHAEIDLRWQRSEEDLVIDGDRDQLEQLIVNVLGNAIDAAGPGGWVEICVFRKSAGGGTAILEISDSCKGPDPSVADRLLEPSVTSKPEGVGLGLAVARQVALSHGGTIDWRRESDRTCFRIELPLLRQEKWNG